MLQENTASTQPAGPLLQPSDEVRWAGDEKNLVLLDLTASEYYMLNATGAHLWRRLAAGVPRARIVEELAAASPVEPAQTEDEVAELVTFLTREGLLTPAHAPRTGRTEPSPSVPPRPLGVEHAPAPPAWRIVAAWFVLAYFHRLARRGVGRLLAALPPCPADGAPLADPAVVAATFAAVDRAASLTFGSNICLPRAAACVRMLRRRAVRARLVLGVRPVPFYAHAWVEVDGRVAGDAAWVCKLQVIDRF